MTETIFIAGASRGVGREIATQLVAQNYGVVALLRSLDSQSELERVGIKVVLGDAMNRGDVEAAMQSSSSDGNSVPPIGVVISTIGGLSADGQRSDDLGNQNLIDVAQSRGIGRFILVSSLGAGDTKDAISPQIYQTLAPVLGAKERAEQHLINSGLTYTIIRPGGLKSEPPTGNGVLTTDPRVAGSINRADVAALVCRCLNSPAAENQVFSALDRAMSYSDLEYQASKL
jgi:nucleoside-diphosphate-sugar epimerase